VRDSVAVDSEVTKAFGLVCIECGALSDLRAEGWRAYLAFLQEEDELPGVVVFCPRCAALEFGES
jgi:hypothetical protein